jgi:hypothetical protein
MSTEESFFINIKVNLVVLLRIRPQHFLISNSFLFYFHFIKAKGILQHL